MTNSNSWCKPVPQNDSKLKILNSLTRQKEEFIPKKEKQVHWYMCGPTVYAPSHMGHARTYLAFDIIRRLLSEYFGYDVNLVMNITNVDDKLITKSREEGVSVIDLGKKWEAEFMKDCKDLNILPPSVLTRVTDYMPEIVVFIEELVEGGLAYESKGSIYFDVESYEANPQHDYCKLEPEAIGNAAKLAEGEGALSQEFGSDKKSPRDFALWKTSKEGEISWPSPWGEGRPGWHIECSVMASDIFKKLGVDGGCMDIHSGGVDLKFPHHDNEMAQSEAHMTCMGCGISGQKHQWVNYFVHSGHLHIKGFKMSKSLKNFITIQQALENNTARQIRMCFLMHKYNAPMDYGDGTMSHAITCEKTFTEFFHNVRAALRKAASSSEQSDIVASGNQKWGEAEAKLGNVLIEAKAKVDSALKDDFDTPAVISVLQDLVKSVNVYLDSKSSSFEGIVSLLVKDCADYVTYIFKIFGLVRDVDADIGFGASSSENTEGGQSREKTLAPVLDALMNFRTNVRNAARNGDSKEILLQCDLFRDDILPNLGIRLEDLGGNESVWKLADPEELAREREMKEAEERRKAEEKAKVASEKAAKDALNKIPPTEFMKLLTLDDGKTLKYSKFSDDGLPTHNYEGEELNKSSLKKAKKEFEGQKKKYDKYVNQNS